MDKREAYVRDFAQNAQESIECYLEESGVGCMERILYVNAFFREMRPYFEKFLASETEFSGDHTGSEGIRIILDAYPTDTEMEFIRDSANIVMSRLSQMVMHGASQEH